MKLPLLDISLAANTSAESETVHTFPVSVTSDSGSDVADVSEKLSLCLLRHIDHGIGG